MEALERTVEAQKAYDSKSDERSSSSTTLSIPPATNPVIIGATDAKISPRMEEPADFNVRGSFSLSTNFPLWKGLCSISVVTAFLQQFERMISNIVNLSIDIRVLSLYNIFNKIIY